MVRLAGMEAYIVSPRAQLVIIIIIEVTNEQTECC